MATHEHNDGLSCSRVLEGARGDNRNNKPAATRNATDLRRARQRARAVVEQAESEIRTYVKENGDQLVNAGREGELNQIIQQMASRRFRDGLLAWLEQRRLKTIARAIRAAFDLMQKALPGTVTDDAFRGTPTITHEERALNHELTNVDAGLLYNDDDSVATEAANRITRTLRQGFAQGETGRQLADRVEEVMTDSENRTSGVSGMTTESKAEMIAHDSIQDAYQTAAHKRYLNNGFRYVVYDATIDTKTSDLCRRMNERVIDIVETPLLIPANHPHCRSGTRPILDLRGRAVLSSEDIADGYLNTMRRNAAKRPSVMDTEAEYRPTVLTQEADS